MLTAKLFRRAAAVFGLGALVVAPAAAGIYLGSFNTLHLGQNSPSGANQAAKKTEIKNLCAGNNCTLLQEVMVTTEVANVTPSGFSYKVSALKGDTTYLEAYGFVYNTTISGAIVNFPENGFSREPSGMRIWCGSNYVWMVNYHAAFDATPNATEIQKLNLVYNHYKSYTAGMNDVIIAGDYNRTATSTYFNNLKATGCNSISPNVLTSINTSGGWANPYDHFAWNPTNTSVSGPARESIDPVYWENNISDHAPIYCWVDG